MRYIFEWRQQGFSLRRIVVALSGKGIKSLRGHNDWSVETIRKILKNEKYHGDVILQKTFVSDYFTGMQSENRDRLNKYLIENSHKAIV